MQQKDVALEVVNASKAFAGIQAVAGVTLAVPAGQRRGIIGPNGAGKTTLFNLITGTLAMDAGTITLFGRDVSRRPVHHRANLGLGRTYQITNLFLDLSVEENLVLAANPRKLPDFFAPWRSQRSVRARAGDVAEQVALGDKLDTPVRDLSHGEQRQLELGMALAPQPRLIMMDEPAAGLSGTERHHIMALISRLDRSITILLVEHNMEVLLGLTDVVTVMHQGQIIAEDTPAAISQEKTVQDIYMGTLDA
ncbi:MAG: ABC transporter ATP-binding protein [Trueperaceae bacterium]|nr:MAG: ABC transporter ATP-binding protein [Trueperaceae bacterium]